MSHVISFNHQRFFFCSEVKELFTSLKTCQVLWGSDSREQLTHASLHALYCRKLSHNPRQRQMWPFRVRKCHTKICFCNFIQFPDKPLRLIDPFDASASIFCFYVKHLAGKFTSFNCWVSTFLAVTWQWLHKLETTHITEWRHGMKPSASGPACNVSVHISVWKSLSACKHHFNRRQKTRNTEEQIHLCTIPGSFLKMNHWLHNETSKNQTFITWS